MKKVEKAEIEKLLEQIEGHPLTQQIKAERAAENLAKRQEAVEKIESLKQEAEGHITEQND